MSANETIYHIRQSRELSEAWRHFSRAEKEAVISRMQTRESSELRKTLEEIKTGQNRLF